MPDTNWIKDTLFEIFNQANVIEVSKEGSFALCSELDSVQLISLIVEIEEKFNIEIPDQYLANDFLKEFENVVVVVEEILQNTKEMDCGC